MEHTIIAFPVIIPQLGGAQYVRLGQRHAWVTLADGTQVRMPRSQLSDAQANDGFRARDRALAYFIETRLPRKRTK